MTTSLNETEQIEAHILGNADAGSTLLFEVKMLLEPELHNKVLWQQKAYEVIQSYGRKQLKQEIEAVHQQLFTQQAHKSFSQKIWLFFTNQ
jgi:hypothetical protein